MQRCLGEILIANGYTDSGIIGDSEPAKVICELKEKIKELEGKGDMPKGVTAALIRIKQLEKQIETFPLKVYNSQSFRKIIKSQEQYIKELQTLLDENGVEYQHNEPESQLAVEGVDKGKCVIWQAKFSIMIDNIRIQNHKSIVG